MDDRKKSSNPGCMLCVLGGLTGFAGFAVAYAGVMSDEVRRQPNTGAALLLLAFGGGLFMVGLIAFALRR